MDLHAELERMTTDPALAESIARLVQKHIEVVILFAEFNFVLSVEVEDCR